jgi:hypothetical protein
LAGLNIAGLRFAGRESLLILPEPDVCPEEEAPELDVAMFDADVLMLEAMLIEGKYVAD